MMKTLSDLKPGDKVIMHVFTRSGPGVEKIATVERLTRTQVILKETKSRYNVSDGHPAKLAGYGLSYIIAQET